MPLADSVLQAGSDASQIASGVLSLAALMHPFDPLQLIQRQLGKRDLAPELEERVLNLVAREAGEVVWKPDKSDGPARTFWRLDPASRRRELARLVAGGNLDNLLGQVEPEKGDRFSHYLRRALGGSPVAVERIPAAERHSANAALSFAADALDEPRATAVRETSFALRDRLVRQAEEERVRAILPKRLFGRQRERKSFSRFIESGSVHSDLPRQSSARSRVRPYLLTGSPGSGKSAFVVDLVRRRRKRDFSGPPVALLDFDRPNLALGGPFEWLVEITRQLGLGHPELDRSLKEVRANVRYQMRSFEADEATALVLGTGLLKEQVEIVLGNSPLAGSVLLLVLDTFEEITARSGLRPSSGQNGLGATLLERLLEWIESLAELRFEGGAIFPTVRVIAAGRAMPSTDQALLQRWFCAHDELGPLGDKAASEFLRSRDVNGRFNKKLAARAVRAVGGHPLTLILLERYARDTTDSDLEATIRNESISAVMGGEAAARSLYTRFVDRLHVGGNSGDGVTKAMMQAAAAPGLILRELTAPLLKEVVAPSCGFAPIQLGVASALLARLADQGWLLEPVADRDETTYRHRSNVRRLMLPMIIGTQPETETSSGAEDQTADRRKAQVLELRRKAIDWFDGMTLSAGMTARTEAAYHRAFLDELDPWAADGVLCRAVAQLAGEDLLAMPLAARAILRYHQLGPLRLSSLEASALPSDLREEADLQQRALARQQGRKRSASEIAVPDDAQPTRSKRGGRFTFAVAGWSPPEPSSPWSQRPAYGGLRMSLNDRVLSSRIGDAFVGGDFAQAAMLGWQTLMQIDTWPDLDTSLPFKTDPTTHWLWQSSLSWLALDEATKNVIELDRIANLAQNFIGKLKSRRNPKILRIFLSAAATIATGRRQSILPAADLSDIFVEQIHQVDTPYEMRLLALSRFWTTSRYEQSDSLPGVWFSARELRIYSPAVLQLLIDGQGERDQLGRWQQSESTRERILALLERAQGGAVVCADTRVAARARDGVIYVPRFGRRAAGEYALARRAVLAELHEAILRALTDADQRDTEAVDEAIVAVSKRAPFWPTDLPPRTMRTTDRDKRSSLLARCLLFTDQCGLLGLLLDELSTLMPNEIRLTSLCRLVAKYEGILYQNDNDFKITRSINL